jgi:hypothetical protein
MHPLVLAILLWVPWLDPFVRDAKPQPPRRQFGQPKQRLRRKRRTVVASHPQRHSMLPECFLKHRTGLLFVGAVQ